MLRGWPIVGVTTVVVGAMLAFLSSMADGLQDFLGIGLRATARSSALLFLAAFIASPIQRISNGPFSAWLKRNRRYLGVSYAVSHTYHLGLIIWLMRTHPVPTETSTFIAGGLAYLFIAAMTATSFDRTARRLGPRRWKLLHSTGMYYNWLIFTVTFQGSVWTSAISASFLAMFAAALLVKLLFRRPIRQPA